MKKDLRKFFSILLTAVFLLPFGIQSLHAFKHHVSNSCTAKEVKHIHVQKPDCSVYHQNINQNIIDFHTEYSLVRPLFDDLILTSFYKGKFNLVIKLKSPRAPPFYC